MTMRTASRCALVWLALLGAACGSRTHLSGEGDDDGGAGVDSGRLDGAPGFDAGPCRSDRDCDDGLVCNGVEMCSSGTCVPGLSIACIDPVDCTDDLCEESIGGCISVPDSSRCGPAEICDPGIGCTSRPCMTDLDCADAFFCNGEERCRFDPSGVPFCVGGTPISCDDGDVCTTDRCDEGRRTCRHRPSGAPGCMTDVETDCGNRRDDDGDGAVDCMDPDCFGTPECGIPPCTSAEFECFDGRDEDCDGLFDCGDPDCFVFPECGMMCPPSEFDCFDGVDNNCNGLFDCGDPECFGIPGCGMTCTPFEFDCLNGIDDDCDMLFDCGDTDCAGRPECCVPSPERCGNGIDDDCDLAVDCADFDCRATPRCVSMDAGIPDAGGCASGELGVAACTNGFDDDCDFRRDCADPDCSPFGGMGECCNGLDDDGDMQTDIFTCRCSSNADCRGVGSLEQVCWTRTYSVCAPRCDFYGGDLFCRSIDPMLRCNRTSGQCIPG
jgi:hypothetical protein